MHSSMVPSPLSCKTASFEIYPCKTQVEIHFCYFGSLWAPICFSLGAPLDPSGPPGSPRDVPEGPPDVPEGPPRRHRAPLRTSLCYGGIPFSRPRAYFSTVRALTRVYRSQLHTSHPSLRKLLSGPGASRPRFPHLGTPLETYHFLYTSLYEIAHFRPGRLQTQISSCGHPAGILALSLHFSL